MESSLNMERAGDLLRRLFENQDFTKGERYASLFNSWTSMAGRDLAAHSHVADVRNGVVLVEVDHPGWLQLLQMKQERVLKSMQSAYPELEIQSLRFRIVADRNHRPPEKQAQPPQDEQGPEQPSAGEARDEKPAESAAQEDDAFQDLLNRLGESIRRRHEDGQD
jgi:predicted nucleic acid-binding Zn ribbon protein